MNIIVHQCLCGESNKAWSLLKTTLPDLDLARHIAFNTGLHDQVGNIKWMPTVRGFCLDEYFLVMKTYPDKSPDVRPGRPFSHVLVIPQAEVSKINDISVLFNFFPSEMDKTMAIDPISVDPDSLSETQLSKEVQSRFNKVIHGFRRAREFKETIIWIGEEDFDLAVIRFWKILRGSEKATMNFGLYFNTEAIPKQGLNFITTPVSIENKFVNHGYFVIRKNETHILTDVVEQFIAGDEAVNGRIRNFQLAIGAKEVTRSELERVIIGINSFEEFESIDDLKKLVSLSHIIAEFSPNEKAGAVFKGKLVDKISLLIKDADVLEVSLLRNFPVQSFIKSESKLSDALSEWINNNLFSLQKTQKKNFSSLFFYLEQMSKVTWWTKLFNAQIKSFLQVNSAKSAGIIFNWLAMDFSIFAKIESKINSSLKTENYFLEHLSGNKNIFDLEVLKAFAVKRRWYRFLATILKAELSFESALSQQLHIDSELHSKAGINILIKGVDPKKILDFTLKSGDKRLIEISGQLCRNDVALLDNIDFSNSIWIKIWLLSIEKGNQLTDGFKEPEKRLFELFDLMAEGETIDEKIVVKIGETDFANILNYKNREKLWPRLPLDIRTKFLAKTSLAYLKGFDGSSNLSDPLLSDYLENYAIKQFLSGNNNLKVALSLFYKFNTLSEKNLKDYLGNYSGGIDMIVATTLGKYVYGKRYSAVAAIILQKATNSNNWRFALAECHVLLGIRAQLKIAWNGIISNIAISTDQWWDSAEEIIIDLYSNPNSITTVWKKAGGKEADLLINATARDVWRDAIQKLRQKQLQGVSMNSLMKEIKKQYSSNENFRMIFDLRKSYI